MTDERLEEEFSNLVDSTTALVGVTDEGLKGLSGGLERVADRVDALRGVVPTDIGSLIGTAFREALAPVQGAPGRDGVDGGIGPQGPVGPAGKSGRDGIDGVDGAAGSVGPAGKPGIPGKAGRDGLDGQDAPSPVRVVAERDFSARLVGARRDLTDGTSQQFSVTRDAAGRISEFVRMT